jgi:N-hydroxyarylamine O-acetyltransferase
MMRKGSNVTGIERVAAYLNRIGYTGPTDPTRETLCLLHRRHMESVPFENLDIGLSRPIEIGEEAAWRKIVEGRRGGFCYELNGAFAGLLRALGYEVTLLSARVARRDGSAGPEFDHLALRVDVDDPWLADVGFGDSFVTPLLLKPGLEHEHPEGRFRIVEREDRLGVERQQPDDSWKADYWLTLIPRALHDFAGMCRFHSTSPESSFTQSRLCSMATAEGRVTLADWKLIVTRRGEREERMLGSEEEWREALRSYFGVSL